MIAPVKRIYHLVEVTNATIQRIDRFNTEFAQLTVVGDEGEYWLLLPRQHVEALPHFLTYTDDGLAAMRFYAKAFSFRAVGVSVGTDADLLRVTSFTYRFSTRETIEVITPRRGAEPQSR